MHGIMKNEEELLHDRKADDRVELEPPLSATCKELLMQLEVRYTRNSFI